jgi:alpha-N-arabinofuranosidase
MSRALFAPAIDYHDGTFAILNTCVDCKEDLRENFLITATNPAGPWSDPVELGFEGIDPSLFFDADGKTYVVNNGPPEGTPLYNGHRAIWMQELDWAAKKLVGPRRVLVNGGTDIRKKPIWIEGPHLFRKGRWYYLMCAEGGTAEQHSEVIFRSRNMWGPYRPYRGNPILTQRDLDPSRPFPVTSTGHAQLVTTQKAQTWAVFLGTRPYADNLYNTGRETFLLPVRWKKGWPVILPKGKPVPYAVKRPDLPADASPVQSGNFTSTDDFSSTSLSPMWLMIRTPHETWHTLSNGSLDIRARPEAIGGTGQPSFIGRRQQHGWADVSVAMRFAPQSDGERAGLVAFQNSDYFYFVGVVREQGATRVCVTKRAGPSDPEQGAVQTCAPIIADGKISLKIVARGASYDFFYSTAPDQWTALVRDADGTILSTKKAGGFVGTVIGMYAYRPER